MTFFFFLVLATVPVGSKLITEILRHAERAEMTGGSGPVNKQTGGAEVRMF